MRKNVSNIVLGLFFIAGGVLYGLHILDIFTPEISFDGWWTLFIIVPCLVSMIGDRVSAFNVAGLGVGVLFLLSARDIIPHNAGYKLAIPFIIVVIGLKLIFGKHSNMPVNHTNFENAKYTGDRDYTAVFCGNEPKYDGQVFDGCGCTAVFGGVELHLENAIIKENCVINAYCVFGGVDIILPPGVKCVINSSSVFGGADNKYTSSTDIGAPTVTVNTTCVFGGLDIK